MFRNDELKLKLEKLLRTSMDEEQFSLWNEVFGELAEYQAEILLDYGKRIHQSCTSANRFEIKTGLLRAAGQSEAPFVSDSDCIDKCAHFIGGDGWRIVGCGYLDCEYEVIDDYCGYDKEYTGYTADGSKFRFVLIRSDALLSQERKVYKIAEKYGINKPLIYAPMFRRLVYIKTRDEINDVPGIKFNTTENGIDVLKIGWRSVWNIMEKDNSVVTKDNGYSVIKLEPDVYALPNDDEKYKNTIDEDSVKYESYEDGQHRVSFSYSGAPADRRNCFHTYYASENALEGYTAGQIILFENFGSCDGAEHILSDSDIWHALTFFTDVKLESIDSCFKEGFRQCCYEEDFEYPTAKLFRSSEKPEIWLTFRKDEQRFLFDRIAYVTHCLTRKYPEYCWKGGYRE